MEPIFFKKKIISNAPVVKSAELFCQSSSEALFFFFCGDLRVLLMFPWHIQVCFSLVALLFLWNKKKKKKKKLPSWVLSFHYIFFLFCFFFPHQAKNSQIESASPILLHSHRMQVEIVKWW